MSESKLVNGVLVLTVEAFAAGQGHSDSGNHQARLIEKIAELVKEKKLEGITEFRRRFTVSG